MFSIQGSEACAARPSVLFTSLVSQGAGWQMEDILKGSIFIVLFFDIHSNAVLPFKIIG